MLVESIAECSNGAFCNSFDLHSVIIGLENIFWGLLLSGRLRQVLLYFVCFDSLHPINNLSVMRDGFSSVEPALR